MWVGREREQSWLGLGNHVLVPLNLGGFRVHEGKTHFNFYTNIQIETHRSTVGLRFIFKWKLTEQVCFFFFFKCTALLQMTQFNKSLEQFSVKV